MRVIDMEDIILAMRNEPQFVLRCEEVFHDKISTASGIILSGLAKKPVVALSGPSGSGKTTTALRLKEYLENLGVRVCMLSMDNFFLPADQRPPEAADWESPYCVDWPLLVDCMDGLAQGKTMQTPRFDFSSNNRAGFVPMEGSRESVILVEGIHMLNPMVFDTIRDRAVGVYVAPRTRIITHDDRIVSPEQVRVARRMLRDYLGRGKSLRDTLARVQEVDRGEVQYIAPSKHNASIHIDTFHDYELCILARYLRQIPEFATALDDALVRENRLEVLMEVVRSLPPLMTDYVPKDSIVREFVGGSRFAY